MFFPLFVRFCLLSLSFVTCLNEESIASQMFINVLNGYKNCLEVIGLLNLAYTVVIWL